ncbi:MAG TPA: hypothetical protein VKA34_04085 [Balneolales bacterium]|nr:hypothetical protein [Balneolales bacterium]
MQNQGLLFNNKAWATSKSQILGKRMVLHSRLIVDQPELFT